MPCRQEFHIRSHRTVTLIVAFPRCSYAQNGRIDAFLRGYRHLKEVTGPNAYRLPCQDDTIIAFGGYTISSVLDLSHGLHELPSDKASSAETAFSKRQGFISELPFPLVFAMVPLHSSIFLTLSWQVLLMSAALFTWMRLFLQQIV
jgi:hypothetical protein